MLKKGAGSRFSRCNLSIGRLVPWGNRSGGPDFRTPFRILVLAVSAATVLAAAGDAPRIVYSKTFKGSMPPFVQITLERNGSGVYVEDPKDEHPVRFELPADATAEIFALAEKLQFFKRPLEAGLKVAYMGEKMFRWEAGSARHEVKFNFTQDADARALQDWFERITESQIHAARLERTVRFDKLGVNQALLELQAAWERGRIVTPSQFLPWLERIIKNETYMHMSRERATALAEAFRAGRPKAN